jgi:hypothetical protein
MELTKKCKICGEEKLITEFGKKDKLRYNTECKICYNEKKRIYNSLSINDKIKFKEEVRLKKENMLLEIKKLKEERDNKKKQKKELQLRSYEERMRIKMENRKVRLKNYLCVECGDTEVNNFYPKRKNKCKKCILLKPNNSYNNKTDEEKKLILQRQKEWVSNNLIRVRVEGAKHRAIRKGLVFELTDDIILQKLKEQDGKCYISKQELILEENNWYGLSLDRLDSNMGYTIENTILVTKFVNSSKNNLSLNEYIKLLNEVCSNHLRYL